MEEEMKCETCGAKPEGKTERRVMEETKQCTKCIIKREIIKGTNAKICDECKEITYPLNTFTDKTGKRWLCNGCSIKEEYMECGAWE